jgi:hypothetical protein
VIVLLSPPTAASLALQADNCARVLQAARLLDLADQRALASVARNRVLDTLGPALASGLHDSRRGVVA